MSEPLHKIDSARSSETNDPQNTLSEIRGMLDEISDLYAAGDINNTQYNALYRHYIERRYVLERILERMPDRNDWLEAGMPEDVSLIRDRLAARPLYIVVARRGDQITLFEDGKLPPRALKQLDGVLELIWKRQLWRIGMARRAMGNHYWMVLAMGFESMSLVIYRLQPSNRQANEVYEIHRDFERANRVPLMRGLGAEYLVFPQQILLD